MYQIQFQNLMAANYLQQTIRGTSNINNNNNSGLISNSALTMPSGLNFNSNNENNNKRKLTSNNEQDKEDDEQNNLEHDNNKESPDSEENEDDNNNNNKMLKKHSNHRNYSGTTINENDLIKLKKNKSKPSSNGQLVTHNHVY